MLIHFVSNSFWANTSIGSLMVFNSCRNFHIGTHLCANTDGKIVLIHLVSNSFWADTSIGSLMVFNSCRNFHIGTHLCANTDGKIVLEASCGLVLDWILIKLNCRS
jgi:hypothetical protein